jgi:sulfur-oxidizing protein SoxZ
MAGTIRIRSSHRDGLTTVRAIIRHTMETGFSVDPETGMSKPPHYIQELICRHGETVVLRCDWSRAVSRNPYLSFEFTGGNPGDPLTISWQDNQGGSDSVTVLIE